MRRFRFQISRVSGHLPGGLFQVAPTYFPAFAVSEDGDAKPLDSDAIKQGVSRRLRKVGWRNDPMSQAKWTSQARRELVDIADYIAVKSRRPEKPNHIIDEIEHSTRPKTPINMAFASPTGVWRGSWSSQTTGHRGPLKARIRPTGPDTYRALFVGRFACVVPFVYPAQLERMAGTCDCYTSSQRLPLLGNYRMTASVMSGRFHATFQGRRDRGTFEMSR